LVIFGGIMRSFLNIATHSSYILYLLNLGSILSKSILSFLISYAIVS